MKKNIFIIGQSIKKTTVNLDQKTLIEDEKNRQWLDLCLDNQAIKVNAIKTNFFDLELFKKILRGLDYNVFNYGQNQVTKQIELVGQDQTKILQLTSQNDYLWQNPEFIVDQIVLLCSANLSETALANLNLFLDQNSKTKLIVENNSLLKSTPEGKKVLDRADLIFVDAKDYSPDKCLFVANSHQKKQLMAIVQENNLYLSQKAVYGFSKARDYRLKTLVWLAILTRVIDYDLEIDQKLALVDQIGQSIYDLVLPNVDHLVKNLAKNNLNINLIGGQLDNHQIMANLKRFVISKSTLDLSQTKKVVTDKFKKPAVVELIAINNLLRTHDLIKQVSTVVLNEQQYRLFNQSNQQLINNLIDKNLLFAIRLDQEAQTLKGFGNEPISEGFEQIEDRLLKLKKNNIKLVNWQADFVLGQFKPSNPIVIANVHNIARFVNLAQAADMIPIVKLNFVTKLNQDFDHKQALAKQSKVLKSLMTELKLMKVNLKQLIIETNLLANKGLYFNLKQFDMAWGNLTEIFDSNKVSLIVNSDNIMPNQLTKFRQLIDNKKNTNISLANQVIDQSVACWQLPEDRSEQAKLRIKFSQILDQIK